MTTAVEDENDDDNDDDERANLSRLMKDQSIFSFRLFVFVDLVCLSIDDSEDWSCFPPHIGFISRPIPLRRDVEGKGVRLAWDREEVEWD